MRGEVSNNNQSLKKHKITTINKIWHHMGVSLARTSPHHYSATIMFQNRDCVSRGMCNVILQPTHLGFLWPQHIVSWFAVNCTQVLWSFLFSNGFIMFLFYKKILNFSRNFSRTYLLISLSLWCYLSIKLLQQPTDNFTEHQIFLLWLNYTHKVIFYLSVLCSRNHPTLFWGTRLKGGVNVCHTVDFYLLKLLQTMYHSPSTSQLCITLCWSH